MRVSLLIATPCLTFLGALPNKKSPRFFGGGSEKRADALSVCSYPIPESIQVGKPPLSHQFPGRLIPNLADQGALRKAENTPVAFELPHITSLVGDRLGHQ